jgi:response regulator RpfG family c-di-GMP phosphodiesterase
MSQAAAEAGSEASAEAARILVVDDERVIREILAEFLALEGFSVHTVEDGEKALTELRLHPYDLLITDLKMPRLSGLQLLERIEAERLGVLTVLMTGFGTVETAIEAMKKGAYDYLLKPFKVEEVIHVVERALYRQRLQAENIRLREALTIYKVSEAIALSHDIEHILDVVLRSALEEVKADVATLHLRDPRSGSYEERVKIVTSQMSTTATGDPYRAPGAGRGMPTPAFNVIGEQLSLGVPILAHGGKAGKFFTEHAAPQDLSSFIAVPLQVRANMVGLLNVFSFTPGKKFDEGHRKMLAVLASRAASAIDNARLYGELRSTNDDLVKANLSLEEMFQQTVAGFAQALEESDMYTRGHSERVAVYSEILARGLTLPDAEIRRIVQAGVMHDVGKIGVRYDMLNKPGKLTPEEVAVFRDHPAKGKRILEPVPCLHGLIDGCWCHHEWWDGGGYPRGLSGHNIPIVGRIVAIADAYDAMTSDRAYRRALPHEVATGEIERCAGTQFDPELAEAFVSFIETWRKQMRERGQDSLIPR